MEYPHVKKGRRLIALAALAIAFAACASTPRPAAPPAAQIPSDVYTGAGESESLLRAMNGAKMDAVRKAVIDMIGASAEAANRQRLDRVLYNTANPNAFVDNASMKELRKDNIGGRFIYEISIRVNRPAIESVLRAQGILGTAAAAAGPAAAGPAAAAQAAVAAEGTGAAQLVNPGAPASPQTAGLADGPPAEVSPAERAFIRRYVDTMTYMVYFDEASREDPFLMRSAVGMANSYLISSGRNAVDFAQVERLKRDQRQVYEEETGQEISMIQWIAQKLNADVYIEIDAVTEGETQGGNHYGSARVTLKMFESSTGTLLGSVPFASPRTFSRTSQFDAVSNALQSTIHRAMPIAVAQAASLMERAYERGIRYELIVQRTPDARLMTRFRTRLRSRVKDVQVVFQSPEETKYVVYLFGRLEELEEIVYEAADGVPGLESMELVMFRGKALTFTTGL